MSFDPMSWKNKGGAVVAELSKGEFVSRLAVNFSPGSLGASSVRMVMTDPDAVFQQAGAVGATVVWLGEDQPYGWLVGRIVDTFGRHWEIGEPFPT